MSERYAPPWIVAARQHGVIKASQLGLPSATIAKWVRTGRLHSLYRGVYAYGHDALSQKGEWMAAILCAGEGAALAGMSAAGLLEVTRRRAPQIEVIAPGRRRPREGFRLRTCRNLDPRDIVLVDRIPCTTVARTLVDLADALDADELALLIHEAAFRDKFSLTATQAAIERSNGRHNLGVLEHALQLHESGSAGSRSLLEKRFQRLLGGLPEPQRNIEICGIEVDFYWPGLCVEVDGAGHKRPRTQVDDRIRDAALRAAGYVVLRFSEHDLNTRPAWVLTQLAAQQLPRRVARQ